MITSPDFPIISKKILYYKNFQNQIHFRHLKIIYKKFILMPLIFECCTPFFDSNAFIIVGQTKYSVMIS